MNVYRYAMLLGTLCSAITLIIAFTLLAVRPGWVTYDFVSFLSFGVFLVVFGSTSLIENRRN